jgi:hypothetical protein
MKRRSASSRSVAPAKAKKRNTSKGSRASARFSVLRADEFDRLADLSADDPAGDLEPYIDHTKTRRPGREVQRVNVDFPVHMLHAIDREAARIGVTRQAFIKLRLADMLDSRLETRVGAVQPVSPLPATDLSNRLQESLRQTQRKQKDAQERIERATFGE